MMLTGNNLGERHKCLNSRVSEALDKQENFEELKSQPETCNVDKLFKIDLASKYKNIDYILEVLKGGDIFYMTRALKCLWLYSDDYAHIINIDFFHANIFPYMSMKMKRKTLTAVSVHVRDADRHVQFYKYCVDAKLYNYADKFLVFTPDSFKLEILKNGNFKNFNDSKYLKQFIGSSFELAYMSLRFRDHNYMLHKLRFLYCVSPEEYLDMLEKYASISTRQPRCFNPLGIRISKDIITKHKQRILKEPLLYVNILNKSLLVKHLTMNDVETFAEKLLPDSSEGFWSLDFYNTYKFILEKLPADKLFNYLKKIYKKTYKTANFEMRIEFYNLKYYEMLNIDEREAWALQHIERDKELPGIKNYMWYKFVSYSKAQFGIKRYIFLTPDKDERSRIVNFLLETPRNQDDINEILCYYYNRHVNESEDHKASFLDRVIELHDVFSFNIECWTSFDKLLYSLDVYTSESYVRYEYKFISLICYILHDLPLPEALQEFIEKVSSYFHFQSKIDKLSEEKKVISAQYLLGLLAKKIQTLLEHPNYATEEDTNWDYDSIRSQIQNEIYKILDIIKVFKRPDDDIPEVAKKFIETYKDYFMYHEKYKEKFITHSEGDFVRWLKQDAEKAMDGIYEIRCNTYRWNFRLSRLFRKLKVYFPNDVGQEYLDYFVDYLSDVPKGRREYRNVKMAVVGVFYLGDLENIKCLLDKNAPTSPKIDHRNIDNRVLQVQKAICRLAYHSRPPIPLCNIQKYISGDYVHFCLPTIYNYFASLPFNDNFIESLLNTPLSIQKHGLRFACKSYNIETLKPIIIDAWKKTRNVSLRMILYETLFDRILNEKGAAQKELYDVLKLFTLELNHDDHDNVYALLVSKDLPDIFKSDFIETAWLVVSKLSDKSTDMKRKISVMSHLENYMYLVQRDFTRHQIIDDHVNYMLREQNIKRSYDDFYFQELINAKWSITAKYIVSFNDEVERQKSLELLQTIMDECLKSWNLVKNNSYILREFVQTFIKIIKNKDPKTIESCIFNIATVYQCILDNLRKYLRKEQIYLLNWDLNLSTICRNIIRDNCVKYDKDTGTTRYVRMGTLEIADAYAKAIHEMVLSSLQNEEFYRCFYQAKADIINGIGRIICHILNMERDSFVYFVCDVLVDTKITETLLLALFMLPVRPDRYSRREHKVALEKVQRFGNHEVRGYLYEKFVLSDCEKKFNATSKKKRCQIKKKKFLKKHGLKFL